MSSGTRRLLSSVCFVAGFVSITASIAIWFLAKEPDAAHGERFGIFGRPHFSRCPVGLIAVPKQAAC
jgi:hypothetical protein